MSTIVDRVRVYQDSAGEWRWQAIARNNEIVGDSGEGYVDKAWAEEAASRVFAGVRIVIDEPGPS